ncbi:MAG: hypothetical protein ACHQ2Z_08215 [Elusimicrobiota bacterium]
MKLLAKQFAAISGGRAAMTAALLLAAAPIHAVGLRTKFGEVTVRGLKIGQEYSLNQLLKLPLRILNTGADTENIKIEVLPVSSASTAGYEPIPDVSWIKMEKTDLEIEPNHEGVSDIRISIPNDPKLLGRRFEAHIWSRTTPSRHGMYGAGLSSILLLEISSVPPSEDELKKKFVDRNLANMDFTLFPTQGLAEDVPLGTDIDLKKERKISIKLVNPNDAKLNFRIRSMPFWESLMTLPDGFEAGPQFSWVKPAADTVAVEGNSIKETALILHIPDEDVFKGKAYVFTISVEILEQEISARVFYELMVKTRAKQEKAK